jgi:Flp pilus assembly protein TadB
MGMIVLTVLASLALAGSVAWLISSPGYEPAVAVVTTVSALVALFVAQRKKKRKPSQQQQRLERVDWCTGRGVT